jgi:hypothetical protein
MQSQIRWQGALHHIKDQGIERLKIFQDNA